MALRLYYFDGWYTWGDYVWIVHGKQRLIVHVGVENAYSLSISCNITTDHSAVLKLQRIAGEGD